MVERLITALCHPSRIGIYLKDKARVPLYYILIFTFMIAGILMVKAFNVPGFSVNSANTITNVIRNSDKRLDYTYEDYTLSGSSMVIETSDYDIYFLSVKQNFTKEFTLDFQESSVNMYIYDNLVGSVSYKEKGIENLDFSLLQEGDLRQRQIVSDIIYQAIMTSGYYFPIVFALEELFITAVASVILYFVLYVLSGAIKPDLTKGIRKTVSLYSMFIYFLLMLFSILFSFDILSYVAMAVPVFYLMMALKRIVLVKRVM